MRPVIYSRPRTRAACRVDGSSRQPYPYYVAMLISSHPARGTLELDSRSRIFSCAVAGARDTTRRWHVLSHRARIRWRRGRLLCLASRVRVVMIRPLRRSLRMVSRWIAVGGLCVVLGLSACGRQVSSGASGASAVSGRSGVVTAATTVTATVTTSDPQTMTTGTVRALGGALAGVQTDPRITPPRGGPRTVFLVRLTSRTRLGAHGALSAVYRVDAAGPLKSGCDRGATSTIARGAAGHRVTVVLGPGPRGWCPGDWRGLVFLQQGPRCSGGSTASGPRCPEFASRQIEVGRFRWQVSASTTVQ